LFSTYSSCSNNNLMDIFPPTVLDYSFSADILYQSFIHYNF
jgi:hypothetical protein